MAQGKAISEDTRAAILAALLAGVSVNETARRYKLSPSTVSRIKSDLPMNLQQLATETRESMDDTIVDHLRVQLAGMNRIAKQSEREKWIDKQSAGSLAELYEKMSNHALQLLEAASAVENKPDGE